MQKLPVVKETHTVIEPMIYLLFVCEWDDECKINKNKTFLSNEMFFAVTSVGWTSIDSVWSVMGVKKPQKFKF